MELLHRRRLPHWYPETKPLFLTWHLHGSLPRCRYPPPGHPSAGAAFVRMDRYLDTTRTGPLWLRWDDIAELVSEHIRTTDRLYELYAWAVMSNHVHLLITPLIDPRELMRRIKGRTAREANLLLGRTGQPFWQAESYDHWVRGEEEFRKIASYIENNPVVAGLVARAEDYRWSSGWNGFTAGAEAPVAG
jgi:REP element-mobilizing transposase RayT